MNLEELGIIKDERGYLVNAFDLPNDGNVFFININPNATRGNHYHLRKTEQFLVVAGEAIISVRDREKGNVMNVRVNGNNPMRITVAPNNTHNIRATSAGCICIVWCDEKLNEEDSDTFPEEL